MWTISNKRLIFLFSLIFFTSLNAEDRFWEKFKKIKIDDRVAVFNTKYVESKADYESFLSDKIVSLAQNCYKKHRKLLKLAEKRFNVSGKVIIAILTVESLCGKYREKYNVVSVYKTLVELERNKNYRKKIWKKVKEKYPDTTYKWFIKRIKRKSKWAKKQIKSLYKIYQLHKVDVFNLIGSWAGAFGLPQFIPSTFLYYAVDGDYDGKIDLTKFPDSLASVANYLHKHGWRKGIYKKKKFKIILAYNHSKLYADTILKLVKKIK